MCVQGARVRVASSMSARWGGRLRQISSNLRDRIFNWNDTGAAAGGTRSGRRPSGGSIAAGGGFAPLDGAPRSRQQSGPRAGSQPMSQGLPMVSITASSRTGTHWRPTA